MAILNLSVVPLGTGTPSVAAHLQDLPGILEQSGLPYQIHAMGTIIEGPVEELFALARKLHEAPFARGTSRVSTLLLLDDRRDVERSAEEKVQSLLDASSQ